MLKNSLYLSAFLTLISGTYIQATLPTTDPINSAPNLAKCIEECKIKGVDPNCEVSCSIAQKTTDTNSQNKIDPNSQVIPTLPGTISKD